MLGAVREALKQEKEELYEHERKELARNWSRKSYDFALFW